MESLRQPAQVLVAAKTFYSKICLIELNSQDTMMCHVRGTKHMRKELVLAEQKKQKFMNGEISRHKVDEPVESVVPIPNPPSTKQKVSLIFN